MTLSQHRSAYYIIGIILTTTIVSLFLLLDDNHQDAHDGHGGHADHGMEVEVPKGPHGGRLLTEDDMALEITLFEKGVPPEFHVYTYHNGNPITPDQVDLNIELARLDGQVDKFSFTPQADYLRGNGVVTEPHSFDVTVKAVYQGRNFQWRYENYEGRTEIARNMADEAGIKVTSAGSATIQETLSVTGQVHTDPNRVAHVRARFPGMVRAVKRDLGAMVRQGDVLATVQSNESLQTYSVKAPIDGLIVQRDIQPGAATGSEPLYVIADLSSVWVEFDLFEKDLNRIKTGQTVSIETLTGQQLNGTIDWISPLATHASQSVRGRVVLANSDGALRPGQYVRGLITIAKHDVPLAVRQSGIQRFRDFKVVFARFGDTYEVRMLELGRGDGTWVEVKNGLKPGTQYVYQNSYLIKADIEKSGASHDH